MGQTSAKVITAMVLILSASSFGATYSGGAGTATDPYKISNVADWQTFMVISADWSKHFVLTEDIDLAGVAVTPVAPDLSTDWGFQGTQFYGVFDGNDHVIRNVYINQPGIEYVSLFGCLGTGGQIRNLGVENANITGLAYVGGLVGVDCGTITSCYATGTVKCVFSGGGLVGQNYYGSIIRSYATCNVSGTQIIGGLVGYCNGDNILSYAMGTVTGSGSSCNYVGGIVGFNYENASQGIVMPQAQSVVLLISAVSPGSTTHLERSRTVTQQAQLQVLIISAEWWGTMKALSQPVFGIYRLRGEMSASAPARQWASPAQLRNR